MRGHSSLPPPAEGATRPLRLRETIARLWPYLWRYRARVLGAFAALIAAKFANVAVPLLFKELVDFLSLPPQAPRWALPPLALVFAYGLARFGTSLFTELRELLFARVTQAAVRALSLEVFSHLHALSLRFHLERQTGALTRDLERGTRAIGSLINFTLYSIAPTLVEISLVLAILFARYEPAFGAITLATLAAYVAFTIVVTNWRTVQRRRLNKIDAQTHSRAVDALLNYETVKYFANEAYERRRYDQDLERWQEAAIRNQASLSALNLGQAAIITAGVVAMMGLAAARVQAGVMTLGDIVLVNAFLLQLYLPLNFLGVVYRELRQALVDLERLFALLDEKEEVRNAPDALDLPDGPLEVRFEQVSFHYDPSRPILREVDFTLPAGRTVAVVGSSGAGKSTLVRLLFRFYDATTGAVRVGGIDVRRLKQESLRRAVGIVPQETVLFHDTLGYNIRYGRPEASEEEVWAAIRAARLDELVARLPEGLETRVGERGLKLSGGEKQRVAIARVLLKNPRVLVLDEATSSLDSATERAIQEQLERIARGRTTLMIAHRLSTVMHADEILVLEDGRIVERGRHAELLARGGRYAELWRHQQREEDALQPGTPGKPFSQTYPNPSSAI